MRIFARTHQLPPRLAAGAFFLNSGLGKINADPQTAAFLHGTAANVYPFLRRLDPQTFTRVLSRCEVGLGLALLTPFVPSLVAGAGLTAFAAGLVGLYLRTPGLRREGSLRPTPQGLSMAKDVWLLGIGLGLVAEELAHRRSPLPGR
ncbi:DoxX family membrane protein [Nonomuraea jiangxiensis]|uniref:DoxX protein n=1 Tax=Nonomuraea jiangxiensis TaxID=633440 RepID=A0A1G9ED31_9ACTN|nr:DoxX family membrane protein [Nonomuraea jiangxiensis]SDK73945.1 DoxX protein [Nonomuraea jiangxiensis]